jgi:hypothetical protein
MRPEFLKYKSCSRLLELDGYNIEYKLAFEFQGIQHYEYCKFFHEGNPENLERQKERDEFKRKKCEEIGINLIVIPYTYDTYDKKHKFIMDTLETFGY